jgi:hypothetical protein
VPELHVEHSRRAQYPRPDRHQVHVIAGQQAALAGVAPADIQEIADVLDRYRGGVRNK